MCFIKSFLVTHYLTVKKVGNRLNMIVKMYIFLLKKHFWFYSLSSGRLYLCAFLLFQGNAQFPSWKCCQAVRDQGKVTLRSTQSGEQDFPGVQWGARSREVLLRLVCCWAGDHSLEKSRPTELEVTIFFSQFAGCSQTWYTWCSALNKEMYWFFPLDFMLVDY